MQFINETAHTDGSYIALVRTYGREYSVQFIAGEIRLYGTSQHRAQRWQFTSDRKAITAEVARRIEALGPEFRAAHETLYEMEAA